MYFTWEQSLKMRIHSGLLLNPRQTWKLLTDMKTERLEWEKRIPYRLLPSSSTHKHINGLVMNSLRRNFLLRSIMLMAGEDEAATSWAKEKASRINTRELQHLPSPSVKYCHLSRWRWWEDVWCLRKVREKVGKLEFVEKVTNLVADTVNIKGTRLSTEEKDD